MPAANRLGDHTVGRHFAGVPLFKLQHRGHQEVRRSRGGGGRVTDVMILL